jgi:hypothetical protein
VKLMVRMGGDFCTHRVPEREKFPVCSSITNEVSAYPHPFNRSSSCKRTRCGAEDTWSTPPSSVAPATAQQPWHWRTGTAGSQRRQHERAPAGFVSRRKRP